MNSLTVLDGITVGLTRSKIGRRRQHRDRDEILVGIEAHSLNKNGLMTMHAAEGDEQRVAVGLRARDELRRDVASAAGPVLDNDGLPPQRIELLATRRAMMSVPPPADAETTKRTCGQDNRSAPRPPGATSSSAISTARKNDFILSSRGNFFFERQNARPSVMPMPGASFSRQPQRWTRAARTIRPRPSACGARRSSRPD